MLIISDAHDEQIFLDKISAIWNNGNYDYLLMLGDITTSVRTIDNFMDKLNKNKKHVFVIPGNNEPEMVLKEYERLGIYLHKKRVNIKENGNLNIVGFGFSNPTPFGTPGELSEDEIYNQMSKLNIDNNTILLTHAPPNGFFDDVRNAHVGSKAIRKIIEEKQPLINLSGHIHQRFGIDKLNRTYIMKIPALQFGKYGIMNIKIINKDNYDNYEASIRFLNLE